jgi:hypothetical protein
MLHGVPMRVNVVEAFVSNAYLMIRYLGQRNLYTYFSTAW